MSLQAAEGRQNVGEGALRFRGKQVCPMSNALTSDDLASFRRRLFVLGRLAGIVDLDDLTLLNMRTRLGPECFAGDWSALSLR